jgi:hypothetical protein
LYIACRDSNNPNLKSHYQAYCAVLSKVIKEAKNINYNKRILNSSNKSKSTWDIIRRETSKQYTAGDIQALAIEGALSYDQQIIAEAFNNYFASIIDSINNKNAYNKIRTNELSATYNYLSQNSLNPFASTVLKSFSTKEIMNIIKSLKSKNSCGYD